MSLREAINGKCKSCVYDDANAGSWRVQVTLCACTDCPLHQVRPVTRGDIPAGTLAAYGLTPEAWVQESRGTSETGAICRVSGDSQAPQYQHTGPSA